MDAFLALWFLTLSFLWIDFSDLLTDLDPGLFWVFLVLDFFIYIIVISLKDLRIYNLCVFYQEENKDCNAHWLSPPSINTSFFLRGWSRGHEWHLFHFKRFLFWFFFLPSRVRFWFFWPDPTTSLLGPSLTCLEGRSSSRGEQGNGREITQSRLREQGNIVRKKTIRAHREATEIAPGWRYVPDNISISAGVQFEPRSTALEEEREEKKTWGLMTN